MIEKILYDVDGVKKANGSDEVKKCRIGDNCPKFVLDERTQTVSLVDRNGNRASMSVEDFNSFVRAVKSGELQELKSLLRK